MLAGTGWFYFYPRTLQFTNHCTDCAFRVRPNRCDLELPTRVCEHAGQRRCDTSGRTVLEVMCDAEARRSEHSNEKGEVLHKHNVNTEGLLCTTVITKLETAPRCFFVFPLVIAANFPYTASVRRPSVGDIISRFRRNVGSRLQCSLCLRDFSLRYSMRLSLTVAMCTSSSA